MVSILVCTSLHTCSLFLKDVKLWDVWKFYVSFFFLAGLDCLPERLSWFILSPAVYILSALFPIPILVLGGFFSPPVNHYQFERQRYLSVKCISLISTKAELFFPLLLISVEVHRFFLQVCKTKLFVYWGYQPFVICCFYFFAINLSFNFLVSGRSFKILWIQMSNFFLYDFHSPYPISIIHLYFLLILA